MSESIPDGPETRENGAPPERMFNAPWPALAVAIIIVVSYAAQGLLPYNGLPFALYPAAMAGHRLWLHALLLLLTLATVVALWVS